MLDPVHKNIPLFDETSLSVWQDKYRWNSEKTPEDSLERVAFGVYVNDASNREKALSFMKAGLWIPAGRILAGAGTEKRVTQINCYVSETIDDSMEGIANALKSAMLTMQQGGGIGMDFSTLRPRGAVLRQTGSVASGPLPFMDMWNSMCSTIMSAGSRRGAMMAVLRCDHPDILDFINAKHKKGKFTNFNLSVLATDAFMSALAAGKNWDLGFHIPPKDGSVVETITKNEKPWYVYKRLPAKELWKTIMESTYEYSEPGVIFIDRINAENNLSYCETISATNPCGEQPLPPNGACNLGAVNLARMIVKPFQKESRMDFDLLRETVKVGVRFLDNVIDVTKYPLKAQWHEENRKRRIGLGITGLANAIAMSRYSYGSEESLALVRRIMQTIRDTAYDASIELAKERGAFPLFNKEKYLKSPFIAKLPLRLQTAIADNAIRNGILLTIAPTGTTSLYFGNVSSGLEPPFSYTGERKILQPDGSFERFLVQDYSLKVFQHLFSREAKDYAQYIQTSNDITPKDHLLVQAKCQEFVDSSISKTINCPKSMEFAELKNVYSLAYKLGCKGCTTYRPSNVRGSIFSSTETADEKSLSEKPIPRPNVLIGKTYKIKWPTIDAAFYITINSIEEKRPFEVFISSKSAKYS